MLKLNFVISGHLDITEDRFTYFVKSETKEKACDIFETIVKSLGNIECDMLELFIDNCIEINDETVLNPSNTFICIGHADNKDPLMYCIQKTTSSDAKYQLYHGFWKMKI